MTRAPGVQRDVGFFGNLDRRTPLLDCDCAGDDWVFALSTESQGWVLIEAMALGARIVSTAVMDTATVFRDAISARISVADVDQFAELVATQLRSAEERALLVAAGRWDAQVCSTDALMDWATDLCARLASGVALVAARTPVIE